MKHYLKNFIESNINNIENEDWGKIFDQAIRLRLPREGSDTFIEEILDILNHAEVDYSKYFSELKLSKEDIENLLTYFREIYQPNRYSGGPDGADFVTNWGNFPVVYNEEDADKVAAAARKCGFKTYRTENGGGGGYDYALISPRSSLEDFVDDLKWEFDIDIEEFTEVK